MFVEQFTKNNRTKLGSVNATVDQRLAANGPVTQFLTPDDFIANENEMPIAPVDTGILGSMRINTPRGPVAIEELTAGQEIMTSAGKPVRLSHVVPAEKPQSALRIRAPYFGANQDLIVANNQFMEIHSEIAEYMFGETCVYVPAWVFKDNSKVLFHELEKTDVMYQLQIEATDGFGVGDCHIAPLLLGSKARSKRFLDNSEARAFATERRIGQYN
jgi:hypothetical protein